MNRAHAKARQSTGREDRSRRTGVARALSKHGVCSRTVAARYVQQGRVCVDGRIVTDPEFPTRPASRITLDGRDVATLERLYLALNKPRGLVTTASDERGRDTVYRCLDGSALPWVAPVGRLDKASEGLLLLTNDTAWAAAVTDPARRVHKVYHVQLDRLPDAALLRALEYGVDVPAAGRLHVERARVLRQGSRHAWLELTLIEGRNRQIRRLLAALDTRVLRLVRVAIGGLALGSLAKGAWRRIDPARVLDPVTLRVAEMD